VLIAASTGFLLGGLIAGLWAWRRRAAALERRRLQSEADLALFSERRLDSQCRISEDLSDRLSRSEAEIGRFQRESADIGAAKAAELHAVLTFAGRRIMPVSNSL
jgi:hypothetical protein